MPLRRRGTVKFEASGMGVTMHNLPRKGQRFILTIRPLDWYAGSVGAGAVVEEVSPAGVFVLFDGGLRESFPPARFAEYFRPEVNGAAAKGAPNGGPRHASNHASRR